MGCVWKQSFARRYPGLRRVHAPEPVSHVPVLRGVLPPRKSRAAGATIVVESSPHHSWSVQARRGTPVLHAPRDFRALGQAGACAALSRPCVSVREGHDADPGDSRSLSITTMQRDQAVQDFARQTPKELFRSLLGFRCGPFTAQTQHLDHACRLRATHSLWLRVVPFRHAERSMTEARGNGM